MSEGLPASVGTDGPLIEVVPELGTAHRDLLSKQSIKSTARRLTERDIQGEVADQVHSSSV
jgi:hypothetical protein